MDGESAALGKRRPLPHPRMPGKTDAKSDGEARARPQLGEFEEQLIKWLAEQGVVPRMASRPSIDLGLPDPEVTASVLTGEHCVPEPGDEPVQGEGPVPGEEPADQKLEPVLFDGMHVEVCGLDGPIKDDEGTWLHPNGMRGLAEWTGKDKEYIFHAYSGVRVPVQEANLQVCEPQGPENGGLDAAWPKSAVRRAAFAQAIVNVLLTKGYCVIQMPESTEWLDFLAKTATNRPGYGRLRVELEGAYLGRSPTSKAVWLDGDPEDVCLQAVALPEDALRATCLGQLVPGRALLRAPVIPFFPFDEGMAQQSLDEEDFNDGLIEAHLDFIQRRRFCLLRTFSTRGGVVELFARASLGEDEGQEAIRLSLQRDKLLIFCNDIMDYDYQPVSNDDVVIQSWLMAEPQRLLLDSLEGDHKGMEAIFGGPPQDASLQVHIMSTMCRFAANARHLERSWLTWATATDKHIEVPLTRFDILQYFDPEGGQFAPAGKTIIKHCAFLRDEELQAFDNDFFSIEAPVAAVMAPSQRVLMETSFEGLAMAGFTRKSLRGTNLMIVVGEGVSGLDWDWRPGLVSSPNAWLEANSSLGVSSSARLAFTFGTQGPCMNVDSACSSVLVGANNIHAVLRKHDKDGIQMGMAMGSVAIITPWPFIGGSMAGLHGDLGRCATFNATANGFVRGEGSGGLFLSAREDPEVVQGRLGCFVSSFTNQDGRSATLTAPNGSSQAACILASMVAGKIKPTDICQSETHGTATAIGDPIEVGSLVRVFRTHEKSLGVVAGKSNVGHMEPVAGGYSLLKLIASLIHSSVPPNVHFRVLSKNIASFSFAGEQNFPGYFPSEAVDVVTSDYALAGVTSFGYGGTNARSEIWCPGRRVRDPPEVASRGLRGLRIDRFGHSSSLFPKELQRLDCITVACPRCLGPMCWLCGMAVPSSGLRSRHHCNTVREESASYDLCSECYMGGYQYGSVIGEPLQPGAQVYLVSTVDAWSSMEDMEEVCPGVYTGTIILGETRREQFHLVMDGDKSESIFPAVKNADQTARILGPQFEVLGQHWLIDGFCDGSTAGTVYQIRFEWGTVRKSISWKAIEVGQYIRAMMESSSIYEHSYWIARQLNGWTPEKMQRSQDRPGFWEWTGIMSSDEEEFNFLRDADPAQTIYPSKARSARPNCFVQGPDDGGARRGWLVKGNRGDAVTTQLCVLGGGITVSVQAAAPGPVTWHSARRPPGEKYFVVGSWSGWRRTPMEADSDARKVYRHRFHIGQAGRGEFQICINENGSLRMYPETARARPGHESICTGPNPDGLAWEVIGPPGEALEVRLDLRTEDPREMVACYVVR